MSPGRGKFLALTLLGALAVAGCKGKRYPETRALALTASHLVLATKGKGVWAAGRAANGALGVGGGEETAAPARVLGAPEDVRAVAAADGVSCVASPTEVACVGGASRFGGGRFAPVPALAGAVELATRAERDGTRVCGRFADGRVLCAALAGGAPTPLDGRAAQIAAGAYGLYLLRDDGRVARVADGVAGSALTVVEGLVQTLHVGVGDRHACAVDAGGAVRCFGENAAGQLGDGTRTDRAAPVLLPGVGGVVSVHPGADFTCALRRDETVGCWGANDAHQLADGTTEPSLVPKPLFGAFQVTALYVGGKGGCAAQKDGGSRCWGENGTGRLGDKTTREHSVPMPIKVL